MNTQVLLFLGKAALLTIAFVLMYRLLLRRETFHGLKRGALMLSLVLSYVLPVTVITVHRDIPVAQTVASAQPAATPINQIQPFSPVAQTIAPAPSVSATESAAEQAPAVHKDKTAVLFQILLAAYLAGLIVMLLLRVRSIIKVSAIVRGGETVERGDGYRIVVTDKNVSPFSWLGTIVVRQKDYAGIDANVLRHEKAHIAHGHPLELMLVDFMSLFQWFNPAVWVLRRDLCLVHEQQADADVLNSLSDARPYQFMLLSQSQGGLAFNIVASFNGNGVESRIDMMNRKRSGRRQMLRFLYIPVLMCISLTLTANVAYDKNVASEAEVQPNTLNLIGVNIFTTKMKDLPFGGLPIRTDGKEFLIYVDGKKVDRETAEELTYNEIKSTTFVRDKAATDLFGPEAADGVLVIETKKGSIEDNKTTHEYVDLGLSVKWATCNVGADKPEEYGEYYAWGETEIKESYEPNNYKYVNGGSAVNDKNVLDIENDVAHQKWGGNWRMPSREEFDELIQNCTWTWTTQNEVNGFLVTSNKSGYSDRSIFLPAAGLRSLSELRLSGDIGFYWTTTPSEHFSESACFLYITTGFKSLYESAARNQAHTIRPVCP